MQSRSKKSSGELPLNVRRLEGSDWQVLVEAPHEWHTCRTEQDACFIASGMRLAEAVNSGTVSGREVAEELDAAAAVAVRALGQSGARTILEAAALARAQAVN